MWLKATGKRPSIRVITAAIMNDLYEEWEYQIKDKYGVKVDYGTWFQKMRSHEE